MGGSRSNRTEELQKRSASKIVSSQAAQPLRRDPTSSSSSSSSPSFPRRVAANSFGATPVFLSLFFIPSPALQTISSAATINPHNRAHKRDRNQLIVQPRQNLPTSIADLPSRIWNRSIDSPQLGNPSGLSWVGGSSGGSLGCSTKIGSVAAAAAARCRCGCFADGKRAIGVPRELPILAHPPSSPNP